MNNSKKISRVDVQVSIMTGIMVILSCTLIFCIVYFISYQNMIKSLQDRVYAIYHYLEEQIDKESFNHINGKEDVKRDTYLYTQDLLQSVKDSSGVMYIYTAKRLEDDKYIYVVDGLSIDNPEFRYPGDSIEIEIQTKIRQALNDEIIMPDKIQNTSWGYIFVAYLPIHKQGKIVGVLGLEFDAGRQHKAFQMLIIGTPFVIMIFCLISCLIAFRLFRRISNPSYRDLANTDMMTGLKNRNAFETDIHNLGNRNMSLISLLSIDLDNLKKVNDQHGHPAGDEYIKISVDILQQALTSTSTLYRTGGDEFVIIMHNFNIDTPNELSQRIEMALLENNILLENKIAFSLGFATYDDEKDCDLMATLQRADSLMYVLKRKKKTQRVANGVDKRIGFDY